jgi:predicted RNase H-like nuclease (RuvC/YqgF family)
LYDFYCLSSITDCHKRGDNLSGIPLPLIVGIDPGTTTAVAVLDTEGNLLSLLSRKNLSRSELSRHISGFGRPVLISSDRRPAPSAVEKIASTFSARLLVPEENLSRRDKDRTARGFVRNESSRPDNTLNRHERDALASALYAYNSVKPTMKRVEQRLGSLGHSEDEDLGRFVRTRVILHGDHVKRAVENYSGFTR